MKTPSRVIGAMWLAGALAVGVGLQATAAPVTPTALAIGSHIRYPSAGGVWQYGFWDAKVRSYYTVNRCHGSSVSYNGGLARSVDTAAGRKSVAEKWALNYPSAHDQYWYRTC